MQAENSSPAKKSRGRPATGLRSELIRINTEDREALDRWIAAQPEPMSRPEALRRAVAALTGRA